MRKIWIAWIISLVLCAGANAVNVAFFRVKKIIEIEFAPTPEAMANYIETISPGSSERSYRILEFNTIVDYLFIIAYSILTFFSFRILLGVFEARAKGWVYIVSGLTGFFDCMENIFLMNSAIRKREDFSWLYYDIVRIKWAFAIVPMIIIPIVMIYGVIVLFRVRSDKL